MRSITKSGLIRSSLRFGSLAITLLNLTGHGAAPLNWSNGPGFRSLEVHPGTDGKTGFTLMDPRETGVTFTNLLRGDLFLTNLVAHNGAGVTIGDADGDGWPDIYLCNLQGPNRLYRNLGQWRFEEMALGEAACLGQISTGATFADVDGDGHLDLLVNGVMAGTRLFLNDGKGHFTEVKDSGLSRTASATSLALADIDGDGDLDLYCTHYIDAMHLADPTMRFSVTRRGDQWEVTKVNGEPAQLPPWKDRFVVLPGGRLRELPEVDGFYRNNGHGHFTPIQSEAGVFSNERGEPIPPFRDWGLAVMFRDLNGDGAPDLLVCNDNASPNRVWINSGRGTFRLIDPMRFRHTSRSSMGLDIADINRDGHDDIIVVDMLARTHEKRMTQLVRSLPDPLARERIDEQPRFNRNTLFLGQPDGSYVETAFQAGVAATDWSFCPIFLDVDLDGYEDLLVSNGFSLDVMDQDSQDQFRQRQRQLTPAQLRAAYQFHPAWPTRRAAYRNRGDGTFEPKSSAWGFDQQGIGQGMALGDLDNDGDLDVVINNLNGVASLYRNDSTASRVQVRLRGLPSNTQGIGARLQLAGGPVSQSQEMICGGRYLSGDQAVRVFAAGANSGPPLQLEVKWRNGGLSKLEVQPNRIYEIDQASSRSGKAGPLPSRPAPLFAEASSLLGHTHYEAAFDDWSIQSLLPRRLSRLGPGVCWYDVDGDGWEDLIVSAGRGGNMAVYLNEQGHGFHPMPGAPPEPYGQGAVVGWPDGQGNRQWLVAISNFGSDQESQIAAYGVTNLTAPKRWPAGKASLGPLAAADIDDDGDLDLFVGGRFQPGRYPEAVASAIWLNEQGRLQPNSSLSQPFASLGLVSGAVFADLDGDGQPDLALALEWGPVRVFRNRNGRFEDMTAEWGLGGTSGWWTSIAAGDFDGDGRLDLVAGNWGRNSFYELYQPGPLRLYYLDWNGTGNLDLIEAWQQAGQWFPVRNRFELGKSLLDLGQRFPTHQAFSRATLPDLLGLRSPQAKFVEAGYFASAVFLNRGSHFEPIPLPAEAQQAPVFSINVGDFDGDGVEDLFLAQNFFGSASDLSRDDEGTGLWLRGTGKGSFSPVAASITGIAIYGEQRGAALADYNHDGRVDLAVSQNNAATKLYINQRAKRGLRVALRGPTANPDSIGAQLRVVYPGGRKSPCRLVQAGAGYWSQDAAAQVLGLAEPPVGLWIRWPGGNEQTIALSADTWEIRVPIAEARKAK